MIAGGGLKMGQAVGASSARGEVPRDRRYTAPQVLSTIYRAIASTRPQTFQNGSGPADVHPGRSAAGDRVAVRRAAELAEQEATEGTEKRRFSVSSVASCSSSKPGQLSLLEGLLACCVYPFATMRRNQHWGKAGCD